jgi:hypothetical protein
VAGKLGLSVPGDIQIICYVDSAARARHLAHAHVRPIQDWARGEAVVGMLKRLSEGQKLESREKQAVIPVELKLPDAASLAELNQVVMSHLDTSSEPLTLQETLPCDT